MSDTQPSRCKIAAVVSFYMVSALVMVFVNKAVLNSTPDLPLSFLFIQLVIAVLLLHMTAAFASASSYTTLAEKVALPTLSIAVAKQLAPVVTINIVGLVFNTLCLRNVDASFFQIARGLLLPLTIAISSFHTRVPPSRPIARAAIIVAIGFFIGVSPSSFFASGGGELDVSYISLFYGFMSSLMIAIHAVLVKSAHSYVDNSSIKLAYWTNLGSAILLFPFILLNGELSTLLARHATGDNDWRMFVVGSGVTGVFGFFLCMAGLISIKVTSPVTHMFSSAARSVLQTVLGVIVFQDIITMCVGVSPILGPLSGSYRLASIFVITTGTLYFTWLKTSAPPPPSSGAARGTVSHDLEKQQPLRDRDAQK